MTDFICISDLRWQSFQHACALPWRFVRKPRVLFVEPPLVSASDPCPVLDVAPQSDHLSVVRLRVPSARVRTFEHGNFTLQPTYNELLAQYLTEHSFHEPILWLYTPAGAAFAEIIPSQLMIYDTINPAVGKQPVNVERLNSDAILLTGTSR